MSLARAFTRHAKRTDVSSPSNHVSTTSSSPATPSSTTHDASSKSKPSKRKGGQFFVDRSQISSPVALVSTTNMLSYDAPDIVSLGRQVSSSSAKSKSSVGSVEDLRSTYSSKSTPSLTDASSIEDSLSSPHSRHASAWPTSDAGPDVDIHSPLSTTNSPIPPPPASPLPHPKSFTSAPKQTLTTPILPERALSHSKKAHEQLARKKSLQSISSTQSLRRVRSSVEMTRTSIDDVLASAEAHPFHKEIQQLEKVAEEFGAVTTMSTENTGDMKSDEEEIAYMATHGLARFGLADYISEIKPLFSGLYGERHLPFTAAWI